MLPLFPWNSELPTFRFEKSIHIAPGPLAAALFVTVQPVSVSALLAVAYNAVPVLFVTMQLVSVAEAPVTRTALPVPVCAFWSVSASSARLPPAATSKSRGWPVFDDWITVAVGSLPLVGPIVMTVLTVGSVAVYV